MITADVPRWPVRSCTTDGIDYRIRPITADDAARERRFIVGLSAESRFQRLMYTLREPSDHLLAQLVNVDNHRDAALVASIGEGNDEEIIGVARYAADTVGRACEFAVVVADAWQCRGVGTMLARLLFAHAAREGFHTIHGTVLADNHRMLELAEWLGLEVEHANPAERTVRVSRRLP